MEIARYWRNKKIYIHPWRGVRYGAMDGKSANTNVPESISRPVVDIEKNGKKGHEVDEAKPEILEKGLVVYQAI